MVRIFMLLFCILAYACEPGEGLTVDGRRYKLVETCVSGHYDFDDDWNCDTIKIDTTWVTNRIF